MVWFESEMKILESNIIYSGKFNDIILTGQLYKCTNHDISRSNQQKSIDVLDGITLLYLSELKKQSLHYIFRGILI